YKQHKEAEKGFGTIKGLSGVRPIHHRLEDRVRAHLLICMLAYYLTWHLKAACTELLFQDPHPAATVDPVAKATRSPAAEPPLPLAREPPLRARHPHPQQHPTRRHRRDLRPADRPHPAPSPRAHAHHRAHPEDHVATSQTPKSAPKRRHSGRSPITDPGNYGLDLQRRTLPFPSPCRLSGAFHDSGPT